MFKRRPLTIDRPHILILHEHHNNRYLLVQSEDDLYRLALNILDWRFGGEKDNYGYYVLEKPEEPSASGIIFDEVIIQKLPSEDLKQFARQQLENYEKKAKVYQREKEKYDAIHGVLLKKDGKRAWEIIQAISNAGGEDDEIELISLETSYYFK